MANDTLFVSIEDIDNDAFVSTGKCISAKCDKNTDLLLHINNDEVARADQAYHATLLMQRNLYPQNNEDGFNNDTHILFDGSDSENLPFIISHTYSHDSNLSNISSHQSNSAAIIHNNMPVS